MSEKVYNPKDFTSFPGATMESIREDAAREIRMYVVYLNKTISDAEKTGLKVEMAVSPSLNRIVVSSIYLEEKRRF